METSATSRGTGLREVLHEPIRTAKEKFHRNAEEREGKLHFKGTVATEEEKNTIKPGQVLRLP